MFVVPILVRLAPEPLKVVPVTVPVISTPGGNLIPPAVTVSPPLSTVGPVRCGDVASTTLPLPVYAVVHWIDDELAAVQKSLVVSVPNVALLDEPMAIQLEPLQYAMMPWAALNWMSPALAAGLVQAADAGPAPSKATAISNRKKCVRRDTRRIMGFCELEVSGDRLPGDHRNDR